MTAIRPTPNPAARPPPAMMTKVVTAASGPCALPGSWAAQTRMRVKRTAAAPSLNRLSASMSRLRRPVTRDSLSSAMTAIGSVALISAPKTRADSSGQSSQVTSPPATTSAHSTTPIVDSARTGKRSRLRSLQCRFIAASNRSGGRTTSKMRSWVSARPASIRVAASAAPASARPTVYGRRRRRAASATRMARPSRLSARKRRTTSMRPCLAARPQKEKPRPALFRRGEIGAGAQIALGIDRLAVDPHFIVQMRSGRAAGRTEPA